MYDQYGQRDKDAFDFGTEKELSQLSYGSPSSM